MEKWVAQLWNSSSQAHSPGTSVAALMTLLLTITLQGNSWANQL